MFFYILSFLGAFFTPRVRLLWSESVGRPAGFPPLRGLDFTQAKCHAKKKKIYQQKVRAVAHKSGTEKGKNLHLLITRVAFFEETASSTRAGSCCFAWIAVFRPAKTNWTEWETCTKQLCPWTAVNSSVFTGCRLF